MKKTKKTSKLPKITQLKFVKASFRYQLLESLALQLESGVSPIEVLKQIAEETETKRMKQALQRSAKAVENGETITTALSKSGLFDPFTLSLVAAGERSGRLSDNIQLASDQAKRTVSFRNHLFSALLYPVIILLVAVVVGTGVSVFVLPRISDVFSGLDVPLPFLTRVLLTVGDLLKDHTLLVLLGVGLLLGSGFFAMLFSKKLRHIAFIFVSIIPGFSALILQIEVTRFGYVAGSLLSAGIPITIMLSLLEDSVTNLKYKKLYSSLEKNVSEGQPLGKALAEYPKSRKLIPSNVQQIIRAGEKSGKLSQSLQKVGGVYEAKLDITTRNITTILEPLLLFGVAIIVAALAIAIIVPIYNLVGTVS